MPERRARAILWVAVLVTTSLIVAGWYQVQRGQLQSGATPSVEGQAFERFQNQFDEALSSVRSLFSNDEAKAGYPQEIQEQTDAVFPQFKVAE
jgi:hypothetical protein